MKINKVYMNGKIFYIIYVNLIVNKLFYTINIIWFT